MNLFKLPEIYAEYNEIFIYGFIYLWFLNLKIKTKSSQAQESILDLSMTWMANHLIANQTFLFYLYMHSKLDE